MWWNPWQKYPNSSGDKFDKSYAKAVSFDTAFLFSMSQAQMFCPTRSMHGNAQFLIDNLVIIILFLDG